MLNRGYDAVRSAAWPRGRFALDALAVFAVIVSALLDCGAAAAQTFRYPQNCDEVTGDEGDDPVVRMSIDAGEPIYRDYNVISIGDDTPPQWGIVMGPYDAGKTYNIYATYTPFLTSDTKVTFMEEGSAVYQPLPDPGDTFVGREAIRNSWTVIIVDNQNRSIPEAYVDFIPEFKGSSPYTMQADESGKIVLRCVQDARSYAITVYDKDHKYLYDGFFPVTDGTGSSRSQAYR